MFESVTVGMAGGWPLQSDVAETLSSLASTGSSPGAMAVLAGTDLSVLGLDQRLDAIRAWERAAAWVCAQALAAVATLEMPDAGPDPVPTDLMVPDWTREELACALTLSVGEAARRLHLAADLRSRLPGTAAALRSGDLSLAKAEALARGVVNVSDQVASAVEAVVLPDAPAQTVSEFRRAVAAAVIALDPDGAAERSRNARRGRNVSTFPLSDGMAGIWAELSAEDTQTVMTGLDCEANRIAARLRAAGDTVPGRAALRADALVDWARCALAEVDRAGVTVQGRRATVHVTVALTTLLGVDDAPAELDGYGPIDADTARRIASTGTWRRLLTDPRTGTLLDYGRTTYTPPADLREFVLARDRRCTFPGCPRPGRRCQLDHVHEWQHGGTTCAGNLHLLCLRHHTCKTSRTWRAGRNPHTGCTTWTSPVGKTYVVPPTAVGPVVEPPHRPGPVPGPAPPRPPPATASEQPDGQSDRPAPYSNLETNPDPPPF